MAEMPIPLGLLLGRVAKRANGAFESALNGAGATLSTWLILMNLVQYGPSRQTDLAKRLGITGATLSHHLEALGEREWISRERPYGNRRTQLVSITEAGRCVFLKLRSVAQGHDARLRRDLTDRDEQALRELLSKLDASLLG